MPAPIAASRSYGSRGGLRASMSTSAQVRAGGGSCAAGEGTCTLRARLAAEMRALRRARTSVSSSDP
eukprot:2794686-Alexandrium_andersonii.AAC.1